MRTTLTAALLFLFVGAAVAQTPAPLEARLNAKIDGDVSLEKKALPLKLTFTNASDKEQTFENGSYRFVLLDSNGEQVNNALLMPAILRKITLKGEKTVDLPGMSVVDGKLKAGQDYYVVVTVRNLTALAKFHTTK